jgi:tellurite resistance protein TehA-like permease
VYSDFLIFWVILGLVVSYSIVLGIGWGALFLKLVGIIVSADSIPPESNPLSGLLTHRIKVVWLFVAGLIVYVFCHIRYEYATGYRLKRGVRPLLVGSLLLLSVLSAAALLLFGLARIIS